MRHWRGGTEQQGAETQHVRSRATQAIFPLKSPSEFGPGGVVIGQDLDGDYVVEAGFAGALNLSYSTGANHGENFIGAEPFAGKDRHGLLHNLECREYNKRRHLLYGQFTEDL